MQSVKGSIRQVSGLSGRIREGRRLSGQIKPVSGGGGGGGGGGGSAYATTDAAIFAIAENVIIAPITAGTVTAEE